MSDKSYHIIVIGAGPAGLAAAIYSAWLGLKTIVLETGVIGGRAYLAPKLENYPGFPEGITGTELIERMQLQAQHFGAEFQTDQEVVAIEIKNGSIKVTSRKQTYTALALIIATGTQRRKLRVLGETEFLGRGVSYCAVCDGPLFRNRSVVVVGNGEEAAVEALALSSIARKVTVVTQKSDLKSDGDLADRLRGKLNIEIVKGKITQIIGEQVVKSIKLQEYTTQRQEERGVDGIFVALGGVPLTEIVQASGIATDRNGCLTVDRQQKTNVAGVFAAGDCTCGGMQVVTAAGEGAMAAMKASAYVRKEAGFSVV